MALDGNLVLLRTIIFSILILYLVNRIYKREMDKINSETEYDINCYELYAGVK